MQPDLLPAQLRETEAGRLDVRCLRRDGPPRRPTVQPNDAGERIFDQAGHSSKAQSYACRSQRHFSRPPPVPPSLPPDSSLSAPVRLDCAPASPRRTPVLLRSRRKGGPETSVTQWACAVGNWVSQTVRGRVRGPSECVGLDDTRGLALRAWVGTTKSFWTCPFWSCWCADACEHSQTRAGARTRVRSWAPVQLVDLPVLSGR